MIIPQDLRSPPRIKPGTSCLGPIPLATKLGGRGGGGGMKQRIQSSHIPLCHRHIVIATTVSLSLSAVFCFALLHCSANQASA